MLLRRLVDYADAHADDVPPSFHAHKPVRWVLPLDDLDDPDRPLRLDDLADPTDRTRRFGRNSLVPSVTKTSGVAPTLAVDTIEYVLGWLGEESKPARVAQQHGAFRHLVDEWVSADPTGPGRVLQEFYQGGHHRRVVPPHSWERSQLVAFRLAGRFLHETPSARRLWDTVALKRKGSGRNGLCLVCGRVGQLLKTIPQQAPARLFPGATQSVSLVSVNKPTHGFELTEQLSHTPICVSCGLRSMAALESVLSSHSSTLTFPGQNARLAWWTTGGTGFSTEVLFSDANPQLVRTFLRSVHDGVRSAPVETDYFCALVVGGNVARAMIRTWIEMPLDRVQVNAARWFDDHAMVDPWTHQPTYFTIARLALVTGRWKRGRGTKSGAYADFGERGADRPVGVFRALVETALLGKALPPTLIGHLVHRVRTDGRVDSARAALLRLALIRSPGATHTERFMPTLNTESDNPATLAGRLFAVLEDLQSAAGRARGDGDLNVTFADRYFSRAVTTPRMALVAGRRESQAWLRRLRRYRRGQAIYYGRQLDELFGRLGDAAIPPRLTIGQQAEFIVGYHQQRAQIWADRASAKDGRSGSEDVAIAPSDATATNHEPLTDLSTSTKLEGAEQ